MRAAFLATVFAARVALAALALPHAGYLVGANDVPVSGARSLAFALHADESGGTPVWASGPCVLTVRSGQYEARLGDECGASITAEALRNARWLQVSVEGTALTRVRMAMGFGVLDAVLLDGLDLAGADARWSRAFATDGAGPQPGHLYVSGNVKAAAFAGSGAGVTGVDAATLGGLASANRDARWIRVTQTDPRVGGAAQAGALNVAGNVRAAAFAAGGEALTGVDAAKISNTTFATLDAGRVKALAQDPDVVTTQAQTGHVDLAGTLKATKLSGPLDTFGLLSLSEPLAPPATVTCSASTPGRVRKGANGLEVCDGGAWWLVPTRRLRSWFAFDDGVGDMALDAASTARSVSLAGMTWQASGGVRGGYVTFAGTIASYGIVPPSVVHGLRDFTVSYWVRKAGAVARDTTRYLFSFATPTIDNAWLVHGPAGTGGVWQHFVLRRLGGTYHIYRDGTLADDYIYAAPPLIVDGTGAGLVIAQDQDAVGGLFDGTQSWAGDFDELKILDYGISDAEIAANLP